MFTRSLLIVMVSFIIQLEVIAAQCDAVFTDGLQNNSNSGEITFGYDSKLSNSPDNILDSRNTIDDGSGGVSCDTDVCTNSGNISEAINYDAIPNSIENINLGWQADESISPGEYNNLSLGSEAVLRLSAGDYSFSGNFVLGSNGQIIITGTGVVRIFIKGNTIISSSVEINESGSISQLLIFSKENIALLADVHINGYIYSDKNIHLSNQASVDGAISAKNITLGSASFVNFSNDVPDFGDFCLGTPSILPTPILEHRFDETSYTGASNEIIDSIGAFHGQAVSSQPIESGKVCNAIDLSETGTNNYAILDGDVLNGQTDFSISLWLKTSKTTNQSILSGAGGSSTNELIMWFTDHTLFTPYLRSNGNGNITTLSIADSHWQHLVWTREGSQSCLFVDKESKGCVTQSSIPLSIQSLILGQEQDTIGGGFDSSQSFNGFIDELLIFDSAITLDQVVTIYDNQNAGLGFDGQPRSCVPPDSLVLEMRFDEAQWNGNANEVVNEVNNTLHGIAKNGAQTDNLNPARVDGNLGTCGYGTFNDSNREYVEVDDHNSLDFRDELTVSTWIYPTTLPTGSTLMTILSKDDNYEFHVDSSGRIFWWWSRASFRTTTNFLVPNNWYHIAITFKRGQQFIYINGEIAGQNSSNRQLRVETDPLQIGQDQGHRGRYFRGAIDEVKIYNRTLSQQAVQSIYNEVHPCGVSINHFEINTLNGQGLTCEADRIEIKACTDALCNTLDPNQHDLVLSVSDAGGVVLNKNVTVLNGQGQVDVEYIHTKEEVVSLSLNKAYECKNGVPSLCDVTFSDTAFRFISNSSGTSIPVQISGKPSNIGYLADTLKVEAVKTDSSGACAPVLVASTGIDMAASYQNPGTGAKKVNISGVDLNMAISGTNFDSLPFKNVPLDFSSSPQHSANYVFTYPDAGELKLYARYELLDDNGLPSGDYIKGTSNPITTRPFAFDILVDNNLPQGDADYLANPKASSGLAPNNPVFIAAGDTMRITSRAVAWKNGDDANANGKADQNENLTDYTANTTTGNFTNITLDSLTHDLVEPIVDGTLGDLALSDGGNFNAGFKVDTATYAEVGIISLAAVKLDYISAGINIEGAAPYVGRFIPSHFYLASADVHNGTLEAKCSVGSTTDLPFVYSGQMLSDDPNVGALGYSLLPPSFTIKAKSSICPTGPDSCTTTTNYIDDFYKLPLTNFIRLTLPSGALAPDSDGTRTGKDTTLVKLMANIKTATLSDISGEITYTYASNDHFVYLHEENSEINEFTSDIDLSIVSIIDEDDVITQDYDGDSLNGLILTLHPTGKLIRFGRAQLENSFGPDTSDLPQTLSVNYFKDGTYVLSDNDTCTVYNSTNIGLTNISLDPAKTPVKPILPGKFSDETPFGETRNIILSAPTTNVTVSNTGQVEVIYDISDWLKYDWAYDIEGVDGLFNDNPRGVATFGIYRGNDRIIYQREISR